LRKDYADLVKECPQKIDHSPAIYLDTIILTALIQKQLSCKLLANRIQDAIDKVYRFRS